MCSCSTWCDSMNEWWILALTLVNAAFLKNMNSVFLIRVGLMHHTVCVWKQLFVGPALAELSLYVGSMTELTLDLCCLCSTYYSGLLMLLWNRNIYQILSVDKQMALRLSGLSLSSRQARMCMWDVFRKTSPTSFSHHRLDVSKRFDSQLQENVATNLSTVRS